MCKCDHKILLFFALYVRQYHRLNMQQWVTNFMCTCTHSLLFGRWNGIFIIQTRNKQEHKEKLKAGNQQKPTNVG